MAGTFSDKAAKAVSQAFLVASTRAVTGAFSIVTGGVTMVYDFYQLSGQIDTLVSNGGAESASQIRSIATQLKKNLFEIKENGEGADTISKECIQNIMFTKSESPEVSADPVSKMLLGNETMCFRKEKNDFAATCSVPIKY